MLKFAEQFEESEKYILQMIEEAGYPNNHPFNDYPRTPESMPVKMIVILYCITGNSKIIEEYVAKCRSIEYGIYSPVKYNQNISELLWLYYLLVSLAETKLCELKTVFDEKKVLINNNKLFEYSFLLNKPECITAFEVKALTCDSFVKEDNLPPKDGLKLVKPFFPQLKNSDFLKGLNDYTVLDSSIHYYQLEKNIKKIASKCRGENVSGEKLYCFGAIFITASTSFEEFYAYLFHEKYGLYHFLLDSNIDALSIVSFDAKNDFRMDNIYRNGYVQTLLPHPNEELIGICKALRLDNFIALGNSVNETVLSKSNEEYSFYKVLCRDGFLTIIPEDSSEQEIQDYLSFLKSSEIRCN